MMHLANENETLQIGKDMARFARPGDIFVLTGELGAGKTTFSKGFAEGLGISQMIKSPTYTLIKEYDTGKIPLYHMDVYRLGEGASDLGLDEYLDGDGVCLIEWGTFIKEELDWPYIEVFLNKTEDDKRTLSIKHSQNATLYGQLQELVSNKKEG